MKVVIPAAGHSRRFFEAGYRTHKMFLKTGDRFMIELVLDMFNHDDEFLIIVNQDVKNAYQIEVKILQERYTNVTILGIENHDNGPSYSIFREEVRHFVSEANFIVSYCDFYVEWDYRDFLNHLDQRNPSGSIVVFSGLQPASLGSTYFAYIRSTHGEVLQVREKQSFTENRLDEEASTGIYYFANWEIFSRGYLLLLEKLDTSKEQYVSLIYNELIEQQQIVTTYSANKFVCLGTPEDFKEYLMWHDFFNPEAEAMPSANCLAEKILIPMAGHGQRFIDEGYRLPKPFIPVKGVPMFLRTIGSLPKAKECHLLARQSFVERIWKSIEGITKYGRFMIHEIEEATNGPGATLLTHRELLTAGGSAIVASCDYEHHFNELTLLEKIGNLDIDGIIFTSNFSRFRMKNPEAFAYCRLNLDGFVTEVVEKRTISSSPEADPLVVGTFWFRDARLLKQALEFAELSQSFINGEIYVGNSINSLIARGYKFVTFQVDNWISYGDPFELDIYYWWSDLFLKSNSNDKGDHRW
jgi:NDP-sugar pyrophosphorylase family protein